MFRHRNHLRLWAARVLALWLMGVVVGIASACAVTDVAAVGEQAHGAVAGTATAHHPGFDMESAWDGAHHHAPPSLMHGGPLSHGGSVDKANCHDFCDKVAASIAPLKSVLDDVQGQAPPPVADAIALPVPVLLPVQTWVPRRDGVLAPPIPIAFLRLAL